MDVKEGEAIISSPAGSSEEPLSIQLCKDVVWNTDDHTLTYTPVVLTIKGGKISSVSEGAVVIIDTLVAES